MNEDELEGRGAFMWAMFACLLAVVVAGYLLLGCATAQVTPTGQVTCAAIGEGASVTFSYPVGSAGVLTAAPAHTVTCEGGPIVPSLLEGVGSVISMVGKAVWGFLVL